MTTLFPIGYSTSLVPLAELRVKHQPNMHPEFARRLFPWLESMDGLIGIGGGQRPNPDPVSPASQQGRSFHQLQQFASGILAYVAVDLVARSVGKHRSPTWVESATAPQYGLHTFIKTPKPEPWHMQCVEMRGYGTWVRAGRPDPLVFNLPGPPQPPPGGRFMHATIRLGDVNADVYGAQSVMRSKAGQNIGVHGTFDLATDVAVQNVQRFCGLTVDGICGPKTWAVLDGLANS